MNKRALVGLLAMALAGCSDDEIRDVHYYVEHPKERATQITKCENNPGQMRLEPNCINAGKALWKAGMLSREMPSL